MNPSPRNLCRFLFVAGIFCLFALAPIIGFSQQKSKGLQLSLINPLEIGRLDEFVFLSQEILWLGSAKRGITIIDAEGLELVNVRGTRHGRNSADDLQQPIGESGKLCFRREWPACGQGLGQVIQHRAGQKGFCQSSQSIGGKGCRKPGKAKVRLNQA